jgi:hypothetical protein
MSLLRWLVGKFSRQRAEGIAWEIRFSGPGIVRVFNGEAMLLLTIDQKVKITLQPVDRRGNPARVDGVPAWDLSDATPGHLEVAEDGMSAEFITSDDVGTTQVRAVADADLGAGIRTITFTLDIQVESGEAVSLNGFAGTPEPK